MQKSVHNSSFSVLKLLSRVVLGGLQIVKNPKTLVNTAFRGGSVNCSRVVRNSVQFLFCRIRMFFSRSEVVSDEVILSESLQSIPPCSPLGFSVLEIGDVG